MSFKDEYPQNLFFLKEATKEYILMSDEQEVYCYYSIDKNSSSKFTLFFVQGFGSGVYSWTDLWDELAKEFNLVVLDPRDKETVKLNKRKKCTVRRIALDIIEILYYLKIDQEKLIFFGSSMGNAYIANSIRINSTKPRCCFFAAPSLIPRNPKFLLMLARILPDKIANKIGKYAGRKYLQDKVAEGFQRKLFYNRVEKINANRWKKCFKIHNYNATEDFEALDCPVYIISTEGDKFHEIESVEEVNEIIKESKIINVPSYDYYHTYPGVTEFTQQILKIANGQ